MARILVVDDAAFLRMMIQNIIQKAGHTVVGEAQNGKEAIEKYNILKPDLVTMDITMPEMDGITAIREIKRYSPEAKIIVCSAMGQQAMIIDAMKAGAKDFVVKPFDEQRVIHSIEKMVGKVDRKGEWQ